MKLYGFGGGDPVNFADPFGLWPGPVHSAMITSALGTGNGDVALLQADSRRFDSWTQLNSMAPWHAMRAPGQSAAAAKAATAKSIGVTMSNAVLFKRRAITRAP